MAKIEKFLKRLLPEERQIVREILVTLLSGELSVLDVKKLKGHHNTYRIRRGNLRVVFQQEGDTPDIVFIGKRGDSKYKKF